LTVDVPDTLDARLEPEGQNFSYRNLQKRRDRSDSLLSVCRSGQRGQEQDYDCKFSNWALTITGAPWRS
jgi:hypothetical protein